MSGEARRGDAEWLRDQLDDLAEHLPLANRPASMQEIRSRLLDIRRGMSWRDGAFQRSKAGR